MQLDKILICGSSGFGKSTFAKALLKRKKRVIVFDPMDEYHKEGLKRVTTLKGLRDAVVRSGGKAFKIAYHPSGVGDAGLPSALNSLCSVIMQAQSPYKDGASKEIISLFIEEASLAAPNHMQKQGEEAFSYCARMGRHYGIEIIAVTQRFKEVLKSFRGNCHTKVYFRMTEHDDVAEVEKTLPDAKFKGKIGTLPVHECVIIEGLTAKKAKNTLK